MLWLRYFRSLSFFTKGGILMKKQRLHLYHIDMKYIRDLAKSDDRVMSVSPQVGKENRPFVGIVVICNHKKYCIPLTSPKAKHQTMKNDKDFSRMFDKGNKLIGCLNFNNMIPVADEVLHPIDIKCYQGDSAKERAYKELLNDQLDWCNDNLDAITTKAEKLYKIVTESPDKMKNLTRRCCDFKKLEQVLEKRKLRKPL
jgi:protein AbiQ